MSACRLVLAGGYDPRLTENREHFEEIKALIKELGLQDKVHCFAVWLVVIHELSVCALQQEGTPRVRWSGIGSKNKSVASKMKLPFYPTKSLLIPSTSFCQVRLLPSFTDAQRGALLTACRAVIYTPQNEHFGIVPLEAMASSRAVVACDSGGPRCFLLPDFLLFLS